MKTSLFIILVSTLLLSCTKKKERCCTNFTYFKGDIRCCYYFKFTASDTVYFYNRYPFGDNKTYYFVLDDTTRNELDKIVCKFKFPKDTVQISNDVIDGTTIAFEVDKKRVMLHSNKGPRKFWEFEETLSSIGFLELLKPYHKKVKFDNFDSMLHLPANFFEKRSQ